MVDTAYTPPVPYLDFLPKEYWGPMMWEQFHARPAQAGSDLANEYTWLENFANAIPCVDCQQHFRNYLLETPPDLSSVEAYFFWGWWAHNMVRRRKGQPLFPWKITQWGAPPYQVAPYFIDEN